jgi:uncharacterized membrane protein YoaK (UPF0700 family)
MSQQNAQNRAEGRAQQSGDNTRMLLVLMLALTFSTGTVDAVGYLGLDHVFTGNMTGNVVLLGMGLVGAAQISIVGSIIALGLFAIGAISAGRVLRGSPVGWTTRSTWLFVSVGIIVALSGVAILLAGDHVNSALTYAATGALGFSMGMQAGTARHLAVKDVTTVVITSTLAGLAFDSRLGGGSGQQWPRRLAAVALIGLGAMAGALLLRIHPSLGLALSALISLVVAVLGHRTTRFTKQELATQERAN